MSESKLGSNGLALSLSARMVMGHSRNESAGTRAQRPTQNFLRQPVTGQGDGYLPA